MSKINVVFFAVMLAACEQSEKHDYTTELGIPVDDDRDDDTLKIDLQKIDQIYKEVCKCVGVDPNDYIGDFSVVFMSNIVDMNGTPKGGWWSSPDNTLYIIDYRYLAHELGHFFTAELIGYDKTYYHAIDTYESKCEYIGK